MVTHKDIHCAEALSLTDSNFQQPYPQQRLICTLSDIVGSGFTSVHVLREHVFIATQLYYKWVLSHPEPENLARLETLIDIGKEFCKVYYTGGSEYKRIWEKLHSALQPVAALYKEECHIRYGYKYSQETLFLSKTIRSVVSELDVIVAVATGGFEAAALLMSLYGKDRVLGLGYSHWSGFERVVRHPYSAALVDSMINGKTVLAVEDVVLSGESLASVMDFCVQHKAAKVYGCTVHGDPLYPMNRHPQISTSPLVWVHATHIPLAQPQASS